MKKKAEELSPEQKRQQAMEVVRMIESSPAFTAARTIGLYASMPDELPTGIMLQRWSGTKRLALPWS